MRLWRARRQLRSLYRKERKFQTSIKLGRRIQAWRHGFLSESILVYGREPHQLSDYLSDFSRYTRTPFINEPYSDFLNNKILFEASFGACINVPRNLGLVDTGRFLTLVKGGSVSTIDTLLEYCRDGTGLVFKPFAGGLGDQLYILLHNDETGFWLNGIKTSTHELNRLFHEFRMMLCCEYVHQAKYSREIFPETSNTIRVLTLIDPDSNRSFLAAASHRFGTRRSGAVDNWAGGGLSARIDLLTGELGPAVVYPMGSPPVVRDDHPDSGSPIKGVTVPGWLAISKRLLEVANEWSFIPYIGWDVLVTEEGFHVLEGNNATGVNLFQVHEPLLRNPRIKRFYQYHNVID